MRTPFLIVFFAFSLIQNCAIALADLDQSYDKPANLSSILSEGFAYVAQTVTPAIAGRLATIEIGAQAYGNFIDSNWVVEILKVQNNIPTGEVLASEIVKLETPVSERMHFTKIEFHNPASFDIGETFAVALHLQGITGPSPGLFAGEWTGGTANPYVGGTTFHGSDASSLIPDDSFDYDLHFRTYMQADSDSKLLHPSIYLLLLSE